MQKAIVLRSVLIALLIISVGIFLTQRSAPINADNGAMVYLIDIQDFNFSQSSLYIKKGDTVVWTNRGLVSHTVTSMSGSELKSMPLSTNDIYSHTFNSRGKFDYHCSIYPIMSGTVTVS